MKILQCIHIVLQVFLIWHFVFKGIMLHIYQSSLFYFGSSHTH